MPRQINIENCTQCEACVVACPVDAITLQEDKIQINPDECVDCQTCERICPSTCINGGPKEYLELRTK